MQSLNVEILNGVWNSSFDAHSSTQILSKEFRKKDERIMKELEKTVHEKRFRVFKRFKNRKSLLTSKTQCQTQTGFRGLLSLANSPKNWKLNQEHPFRHMVCPFYRKDDLPLEHLPSSLTNVTSLDTKHPTGFFSKRYILFQPKLIWVKYGLWYLEV